MFESSRRICSSAVCWPTYLKYYCPVIFQFNFTFSISISVLISVFGELNAANVRRLELWWLTHCNCNSVIVEYKWFDYCRKAGLMASWQRITSCVFHFLTSSREKNLVNQAAEFCVKNALKLTSDHLRLEKIFRGLYPRTPEGRGEEREKRGG